GGNGEIKHMFVFVLDTEQVFGNNSPMRRTHVRNRRIAALFVAALVFVPVAKSAAGTTHKEAVRTRAYVVQPGDTLWSIAGTTEGSNQDPRPLIDQIVSTNGVDPGNLVPGQVLRIPVDPA